MFKARILGNLRPHGAKWVNVFITMGDTLGERGSGDCLRELMREGKVEEMSTPPLIDKFGNEVSAPLYRITPSYDLTNNKHSHLTVVE